MAIYLPKQHLAIDVVDDPCRDRVDKEAFPGLTVVALTCEELAHLGRDSWGGQAGIGTGRMQASPGDAGAS